MPETGASPTTYKQFVIYTAVPTWLDSVPHGVFHMRIQIRQNKGVVPFQNFRHVSITALNHQVVADSDFGPNQNVVTTIFLNKKLYIFYTKPNLGFPEGSDPANFRPDLQLLSEYIT